MDEFGAHAPDAGLPAYGDCRPTGLDAVSLAGEMRSLTRRFPLLLVVLLLTLTACGEGEGTESTGAATDTTADSPQSIEGPPWRLVAARGVRLPEATSLTIQFQDGAVSGSSVCNRFSGPYELEGTALTIGELALTEKACPEQLAPVETTLVRMLGRVESYRFDGPRLELLNPNEQPILTYRPFSAADVRGNWVVTGLLDKKKEAFSTPIEGTRITANFKKGGQLQGNASCNEYSSSYEVDGNTIAIGEPTLTRKACEQPKGRMGQENRYVQALNQAVTFELNGPNLVLFDGEGIRLVSYRPAAQQGE